MEIKWLGTAGFLIRTGGEAFLTDPYITRNAKAAPFQPLTCSDLCEASRIFISHGHFDHLLDVPGIVARTGARVYCTAAAAQTLKKNGVPEGRIRTVTSDLWKAKFRSFSAQAVFSRHVRFDRRLLTQTLLRTNVKLPGIVRLLRAYPCGQVLAWRFRAEGKTLLFFGSAGEDPKEISRLADPPPDILLVPLQGHSDICAIAAEYVRALQPGQVIPHHQDDFFPPVSRTVDIRPFLDQVSGECPGTRIRTMALNETLAF